MDHNDREILQKAHGTMQGSIISLAQAVLNKFAVLEARIKDLENAQISMPDLQDDVQDDKDSGPMPESGLSKPKDKTTQTAKKVTTRKAKIYTK